MRITFNNGNGKLDTLVADIDEQTLKSLLADYTPSETQKFLSIRFENASEIKNIPEVIFYPATQTGLYNKSYDNQYDLHYVRYNYHDTSSAFFVKTIAQYILKTYFKKKKISVIAITKPYEMGTVYCDIFKDNPVYLARNLDSHYAVEQASLYFIPTEQWDEMSIKESRNWSAEQVNFIRTFPNAFFNLSGGKYYTKEQLDAEAEFKNISIVEQKYGDVGEPRIFKVEIKNGEKGLVLSRGLSQISDASAHKTLKANFAKYYPQKSPIKTVQEISNSQWLNIRTASKFEIYLD